MRVEDIHKITGTVEAGMKYSIRHRGFLVLSIQKYPDNDEHFPGAYKIQYTNHGDVLRGDTEMDVFVLVDPDRIQDVIDGMNTVTEIKFIGNIVMRMAVMPAMTFESVIKVLKQLKEGNNGPLA